MKRDVLLVNPWIYDFAAYDLWAKPLGLLYIASLLRKCGYRVSFLDCLDRFEEELLHYGYFPKNDGYGCGAYYSEEVEKPSPYKDIKRRYKRYGIPVDVFLNKLNTIPPPNLILITSGMTYWYPGVFLAVELLKKRFPKTPILLGGVYATLCSQHAKDNSGAHYVFKGGRLDEVLKIVNELIGVNTPIPNGPIYPAFELLRASYICILTSRGCPYRCSYCASSILYPGFLQRPWREVVNEIEYFYKRYGVKDFAFYDDALLWDAKTHICLILEEILRRGIQCNFHAPNGLHARYIDKEVAMLLRKSGFKTLRLSFETVNVEWKKRTGNKVTNEELKRAISYLKEAGFRGKEIGVYVMVGLPGQEVEDVVETIHYVASCGGYTKLAEYSPVPGTPEFELVKERFKKEIEKEPLLHNNSVFLLKGGNFSLERLWELKNLVKVLNSQIELKC